MYLALFKSLLILTNFLEPSLFYASPHHHKALDAYLQTLLCSSIQVSLPNRTLFQVSASHSSYLFDKFNLAFKCFLVNPGFLAAMPTFNKWRMCLVVFKQVSRPTVVVGEPKAPFSIATKPCCREEHYSFPSIALPTLDLHFIMLSIKQEGIKFHFFASFVWLDLGLNPGFPDHWWTLKALCQWIYIKLDNMHSSIICHAVFVDSSFDQFPSHPVQQLLRATISWSIGNSFNTSKLGDDF